MDTQEYIDKRNQLLGMIGGVRSLVSLKQQKRLFYFVKRKDILPLCTKKK
jgi:hypothetical protein